MRERSDLSRLQATRAANRDLLYSLFADFSQFAAHLATLGGSDGEANSDSDRGRLPRVAVRKVDRRDRDFEARSGPCPDERERTADPALGRRDGDGHRVLEARAAWGESDLSKLRWGGSAFRHLHPSIRLDEHELAVREREVVVAVLYVPPHTLLRLGERERKG